MLREYYKDRTLFVAGATGFVGQALVAKVLADLSTVRRVFMLIRPRRRVDGAIISPTERLQEFFDESVFGPLRARPADFSAAREKVVAVAGDLTLPGLGISPEQRQTLEAEVDTIFNSAATVVFDEPLDVSLNMNTNGPLALLELARSCRKKVDFVHISTAYVNGQLTGSIPEEMLPPGHTVRDAVDFFSENGCTAQPAGETRYAALTGLPGNFDPEAEIADCKEFCHSVHEDARSPARETEFRRTIRSERRKHTLTDGRLDRLVEDRRDKWIEQRLVSEGMARAKAYGWNDIYTFTKALGEQMLVKYRGDQVLAIVRPSIIESSLVDPEPGWITGLKVMDPLVTAYGRGLLPDFPAEKNLVLDLIPVDIVVNATLAAATQAVAEEVRIYQVATGSENPARLTTLFSSVRDHFLANPLRDRDGRAPTLRQWTYSSVRRFKLKFYLMYLIPVSAQEWVLDKLPEALANPRKRRLLASLKVRLKRVLYYADIYHPYTHLHCAYETTRTREMFEKMPSAERELFNTDVTRIDWPTYMRDIHIPGLRRHVLKDEVRDSESDLGSDLESGSEADGMLADEAL